MPNFVALCLEVFNQPSALRRFSCLIQAFEYNQLSTHLADWNLYDPEDLDGGRRVCTERRVVGVHKRFSDQFLEGLLNTEPLHQAIALGYI